jgi:RNA binding exosome subunit
MARYPCRQVLGEVFVHESEELDKVKKAFSLIFPEKSMKEETVAGILGTSIKVMRAELDKKNAKQAVEKLAGMLSQSDKRQIINELKLRLSEEGRLYLRFDKQRAYAENELKLVSDEEDSMQIIIVLEAYPSNMANFIEAAKKIFFMQ